MIGDALRRLALTAVLLGSVACGAPKARAQAGAPQSAASGRKTQITIADTINFAEIGSPLSIVGVAVRPPVAVYAPDGKHVAIVVRSGDAEQESNQAKILVYDTAELLEGRRPMVVAAFSSRSNYQPISLLRWLDDRTIIFAGTTGDEPSQIYRVDIESGKLVNLTHAKAQLAWFDTAKSGSLIVTMSYVPDRPMDRRSDCAQDGCVLPQGRYIDGVLNLMERGAYSGSLPLSLFDVRQGREKSFSTPEDADADIDFCPYPWLAGGISPDGRFGLRRCFLKPARRPGWWAEYESNPDFKLNGAQVLVATDFETGQVYRVSDAPYVAPFLDDHSEVLWIDGGRHFLVIDGYETLSGVSGEERLRRVKASEILEIDPVSRSVTPVATLKPGVKYRWARWDQRTQTFFVGTAGSAQTPGPILAYKREGAQWRSCVAPKQVRAQVIGAPSDDSIRVEIMQSLNDPPKLFAVDTVTGVRRMLLDPNPWLASRDLGRVEEVKWISKDGREYVGGLYYPSDYVRGRRYPLVIQTHGFEPGRFSMTGDVNNDNARALNAVGVVVLQMADIHDVEKDAGELRRAQLGYESAIDYLDRLGIIDRSKVGIQGWSRTGEYVAYTLTHSAYHFAADAFTSSTAGGLWFYFASEPFHHDLEVAYGAKPSDAGMEAWLKTDPDLNIDRMHTPTLIWEEGAAGGISSIWDLYSGLRSQGVPVEDWYFPDGRHEVYKASERLRTTQLLVDWFRFWLEDEEDPDSSKSQQYARWEGMRKDWRQRQNDDVAH